MTNLNDTYYVDLTSLEFNNMKHVSDHFKIILVEQFEDLHYGNAILGRVYMLSHGKGYGNICTFVCKSKWFVKHWF